MDTNCDILHIKLLSLESADSAGSVYRLKIKYLDSLLLVCDMVAMESFPLQGRSYCYDYAEYPFDVNDIQHVCRMVNRPLIVTIEPTTAMSTVASTIGPISSVASSKPPVSKKMSRVGTLSTKSSGFTDISFCNIDMLPVICGENKVKIRKRLEPIVQPNILFRKSWCNLSLVTLELYVERSQPSLHEDLMKATAVELTVLSAYNLPCEGADKLTFTMASQLPVMNSQEFETITFRGDNYNVRNMSDPLDWESIRQDNVGNSRSDKKFSLKISEIINVDNLDLNKYLNTGTPSPVTAGTVGWHSWQRSLVKCDGGILKARIRDFKWPVEVRAQGEFGYLHFITFIDLFPLLYPGERRVVAAARLWWYQPEAMVDYCGCSSLLPPEPSSANKTRATTRQISPDVLSVDSSAPVPVSNADDNPAFIVIEFTLSSPLLESCIPPQLTDAKLSDLLSDLERSASRRHNTGRGRADNFKKCISDGAKLLRSMRTPGSSERCITSRQLGESRQLLALHTSLVNAAALHINDSFVLKPQYSDKDYEDLLLTAHSLLLREAALVIDEAQNQPAPEQHTSLGLGPRIAARCSRQLRDNGQAARLFLECVALTPLDAGAWRELGTCLKDNSYGRARVCLKKSLLLDPRNPLTLLSLASIVWKENIEAAESFFLAILTMHPMWLPGWIAAYCYYKNVEKFLVADAVLEIVRGMPMKPSHEPFFPREWAQELGDWWEQTPLLDPYSPYLDTADMLLRLRAIDLAELCLAQHQIVHGKSAPYLHLLGLCFFLRGEYSDALCHVQKSLVSHGELKYLLALTGACMLNMGNISEARAAYTSAINAGATAANAVMRAALLNMNKLQARAMLEQLVRRRSCAQVWILLAYNWIVHSEFEKAENCCIEALGKDRRFGIAWVVLMRLLVRKGRRVRAEFCQSMADYCGHVTPDACLDCITEPAEQIHVIAAEKLRECACACPDEVEDDITSKANVY